MSANIIGIFLRNASSRPDATAIVDGDRRISYAELARDVRRVAAHLVDRGIGAGENVLVFVPMSSQLYTLLLALFYIGATAVFVDAWADRSRLALACRAISLKGFIGIPKAHLLRFLSADIRRIPVKLVASIDAWSAGDSTAEPAVVSRDEAALVTFTTGSSGAPKGAVRTHGFLVAQHEALLDSFGTKPGEIDMPVLPIFALNNLASGATTVIPALDPRRVDDFDAAAIVAQISRERVETTTGSPAFYRRLAEYCVARGRELHSLKRIFLGGAAVGPDLARLLVKAFPDATVSVVYGSTEAEPVSHIDAHTMLERAGDGHAGLPVGRPIERIDVMILPIVDGGIDAQSQEELSHMALGTGERGEICVAGDHVLTTYHGDSAAWSHSKIKAGERVWHRMGDAGYLDDSGMLWLVGSVKQSFVHNGSRTFVLPVELMLAEIEGIDAATIVQHNGRVTVIVEAHEDARRAELEASVRDRVHDVDDIRFIDAMPRDPRHRSKINYEALRQLL